MWRYVVLLSLASGLLPLPGPALLAQGSDGQPSSSADESLETKPGFFDAGFVVRCAAAHGNGDAIEARCESLRDEWHGRWLKGRPTTKWKTPCEVVVHARRSSYLAAVGRAGTTTTGSSLVRRGTDGHVVRRIDLLATSDGELPALAHELVHVILADHFPDGAPPLWLDEGLAMLMDSPAKRARHWRDCDVSMQLGTALPLQRLVELDRPPAPDQFPAVYGQSLALTEFLADRSDPAKLLLFAIEARSTGPAEALRSVYGLANWEELEREWHRFARTRLDQ